MREVYRPLSYLVTSITINQKNWEPIKIKSENKNRVNTVLFNIAYKENKDDEMDYSTRNRYDFFAYVMPESMHDIDQKTNQRHTRKPITREPVIIKSNLDSDYDITTMVDHLLTCNELSDVSSIFVVVPTSDDNYSGLTSDCSTICIQLSEHNHNWNQKQSEKAEPAPSRRISTRLPPCGLKISAKGKLYCLEGMDYTVPSFHDKETMSEKENIFSKLSKFCLHKMEEEEKTHYKNKLCQIYTPNQKVIMYQGVGVSTDTTSDRPCCCAPKPQENHYHKPEHRHVSELVTPLLINRGPNNDGYRRLPKVNVIQQASFVSTNRAPMPVSPCVIPSCRRPVDYHHPPDMYQMPSETSSIGTMPPSELEPFPAKYDDCESTKTRTSVSIRELFNSSRQKQSEPCQCSPEKIKEMFEEVLRGKAPNLRSTACGAEFSTGESMKLPISQKICKEAEVLETDSDDDEGCKYIKNYKLDCSCDGKNKMVKIAPLCPCQSQKPSMPPLPPMSKTTAGPKPGTRSMGCQCCCCDETSKKDGKDQKVLGPSGGVCQMEPGGTYCQAGQIKTLTPTTTTTSERQKGCVCSGGVIGKPEKKKGFFSRNKTVICECPKTEPQPQSDSQGKTKAEPEPELEPDLDNYYYQYRNEHYAYIDEKQILRQKSDMTQTQSGFRFFKGKRPPVPPEPEFTVEDAVRYYIALNPDFIKEFCPPPEPKDCPCSELPSNAPDKVSLKSKKSQKKNNKIHCDCPGSPAQDETPSRATPSTVPPATGPTPPAAPEKPEIPVDEGPSGGFKFSIGGKGSASKANLFEESTASTKRTLKSNFMYYSTSFCQRRDTSYPMIV
ncbi:hypothetical protein PYW08_000560 [Mythimna loreyi]|uniref:Uncharacterized protein n=1 Tax=Mythimna loreyi TaxID=667449 RepID=A0ACC2RCV8_9NEOP|nr:hypothetical protein PYW08_000560 [Mythimna loreyi]